MGCDDSSDASKKYTDLSKEEAERLFRRKNSLMLEYKIHELNADAHPTRVIRGDTVEEHFAADKFEQFSSVSRGITNICMDGKDANSETLRHPVLDSMTTSSNANSTAGVATVAASRDVSDVTVARER